MKTLYQKILGRTGNQLFQLWIGEYLRQKLQCNLVLYQVFDAFIPFLQQYKSSRSPVPDEAYTDVNGDIENVVLSRDDNTYIEGYFEDAALVFRHRQFIENIYQFDTSMHPYKKCISVHLRLNDLWDRYINYMDDYIAYINGIVERYPDYPIYIVTSDGYSHLTQYTQYKLVRPSVVVSSDHMHDFLFLLTSSVIVSASTSYTWWAAFLNKDLDKYYVYFTDKMKIHNDKVMYNEQVTPSNWIYHYAS